MKNPKNFKKTISIIAALTVVLITQSSVFAQTTTTETQTSLSYNVGLVSDYRYRGISQSARKPALQGGIDYADKSGFYVGNWNSTIEWIKDTADASQSARGPLEMDIYAGYKSSITELIGYDIGVLQYYYPSNSLSGVTNYSNANTTELYGALSVGSLILKVSDSVTNLFGYLGSKNSMYVDLSYNKDFGNGWSGAAHYGNQSIRATNAVLVTYGVTDYSDYSVSLNKDFDSIVVNASIIGTDWAKRGYLKINDNLPGSGTSSLAGTALILGVKKNF
jgi:uncharacterized protein (TIGR02001 family)